MSERNSRVIKLDATLWLYYSSVFGTILPKYSNICVVTPEKRTKQFEINKPKAFPLKNLSLLVRVPIDESVDDDNDDDDEDDDEKKKAFTVERVIFISWYFFLITVIYPVPQATSSIRRLPLLRNNSKKKFL